MKTILVAEVGINHNGSLKTAKQLIDVAVIGGCKYVKFQKRTIDLVYSKEELDRYRESPWGTTNRAQKEGLEFNREQYDEIDFYCRDKGVAWFASPWDAESVKFLATYNPLYIKIASALLTNMPLIEEIKKSNIPVIISTGMSSKEEIDNALSVMGNQVEFIMSCTSTYPTMVEDMNMKRIQTLKELYGKKYRIGFSNHSAGLTFIYMAHLLGAEMIEYHITLDRSMYGSDQAASIEIPGVLKIKEYLSDFERSMGSGDLGCLNAEIAIRDKLRKSV